MNRRARAILWVDGGAALGAGLSMLALRDWLARLHAFSLDLVLFLGMVNLAYAAYSGSLAIRASLERPPSRRAIDVLVAANLLWAAFCAALLAKTWRTASVYGLVHIGFEGCFVAALAACEWYLVRPACRAP